MARRRRGRGQGARPPLSASTRRSSSISRACRLSTAASESTSLTVALLTTRLARQAKRNVLWLSSAWTSAGVMAQMMAVLALPPSEGCRMRVSLLSRYGMCPPARRGRRGRACQRVPPAGRRSASAWRSAAGRKYASLASSALHGASVIHAGVRDKLSVQKCLQRAALGQHA